jgi:hypothetical protein
MGISFLTAFPSMDREDVEKGNAKHATPHLLIGAY